MTGSDCDLMFILPGRLGPTVGDPSYELVLNGDAHLAVARWDVASWPDRVHARARALKSAVAGPQVQP